MKSKIKVSPAKYKSKGVTLNEMPPKPIPTERSDDKIANPDSSQESIADTLKMSHFRQQPISENDSGGAICIEDAKKDESSGGDLSFLNDCPMHTNHTRDANANHVPVLKKFQGKPKQ